MATHSSILAWKIPWAEEPGGYSPWGLKKVRHDLVTKQQLCAKHYRNFWKHSGKKTKCYSCSPEA